MLKQNLRNQQPCNLLPKSPEPYQERRWQSRILHSLTLNHAFSLGHGSIKVLPTPDNMAQQRKGHAKKSYKVFWTMQGFWSLVGKGRMFGRPFCKTNPQELSTLCIYPEKLLNTTKNVSINKTLSITNVAHDFYPAALKEHQMINCDPDRVLFWKTCTGKKCINVYTLDLGWYAIEGHLLEQLLRPLHAIK